MDPGGLGYQLIEAGMDEVGELDLNDRFCAGCCHPDSQSDDECLGDRGVERPGGSEGIGESGRGLEHTALRIGHVLAECDRVLVEAHHVVERLVDGGDQVDLLADRLPLDRLHRLDGCDRRRINAAERIVGIRGALGPLGSGSDSARGLLVDGLLGGGVEKAVFYEVAAERWDRVLSPPLLDLFSGSIQLVVVVGRVGVVAVGLGLDEGGAFAGSGLADGRRRRPIYREQIVAVDNDAFDAVAVSAIGDLAGDLIALWDRDRIHVVLDQEDHWKVVDAGKVHCLVPITLRGRAFSAGDEHDAVGSAALQLVGDAGGVRVLGRDRRGVGEDIEIRLRPVTRHLSAAGRGVALFGEHAQENVFDAHPEPDIEGDVPVVGEGPVLLRVEGIGCPHLGTLVARYRHHEANPALPVQRPRALVELAGEHHPAVHLEQVVVAEAEHGVVADGLEFEGHFRLPRWCPGRLSSRSDPISWILSSATRTAATCGFTPSASAASSTRLTLSEIASISALARLTS